MQIPETPRCIEELDLMKRLDACGRGQSKSRILHHAVVHFCVDIAKEIEATRATFGVLGEASAWPFVLPAVVKHDIHIVSKGTRRK